jgi:glycosyltransferase involved in cell wall biosynthesis
MSTEKECSIIIPAYNEEEVIGSFIADLKQILKGLSKEHEIIVVDDGSSDDTYSVISDIEDVKVIRHPYNKGNGAAVKTGILHSCGENIVIIDADGQHDPRHIPEMLELLEAYDLVVGARTSFGVGSRGIGNRIVSRLASYLSGIHIPDLTCGYRAFKREKMLEFIDLLPNGYSLPSTSTLAYATSGYNIKFLPIRPNTRQGGQSSVNVFRDGMKFLVLIVRMVSLFKPLKVFVPISLFFFLLSFLWSIRTISFSGGLSPTVAMLFMAGVFSFLFGLLADQVAEVRLSVGRLKKEMLKQMTYPSPQEKGD